MTPPSLTKLGRGGNDLPLCQRTSATGGWEALVCRGRNDFATAKREEHRVFVISGKPRAYQDAGAAGKSRSQARGAASQGHSRTRSALVGWWLRSSGSLHQLPDLPRGFLGLQPTDLAPPVTLPGHAPCPAVPASVTSRRGPPT